ncbi:NACHT domain-containing protein [Calothrix sp. CCY 0018]|uniref:NACHT domain-containing protein n=1 Tax=Calothrix sp. CCY 0018 TaxID=3103864 RepID=UPI0039C70C50
MLVKWDESRGVHCDEVYRNLSFEHKIELLNQIAAITFDKNSYFFKQSELEKYIFDYLQTLPNAETDQIKSQSDSKSVLKSIKIQHGLFVERARGIYSFSHLTFQEYFTAKVFYASFEIKKTEQRFIRSIFEKNWREVILFLANLMQ